MAKYCNNPDCQLYKKYQEGAQCDYCGEPLVDDTPVSRGTSKEVKGDGISVSRVMKDSHDTISNQNTTIVINGKSLEDLTLKDRKTAYRKFCSEHINNGIITPTIRRELDEYALELELSPDVRKEIEQFVRKNASETSRELTPLDYDNLAIIKTSVANNKVRINDALPKLEAMSTSDNDEVLFYLNLLLVCSSPASIIKKYCEREQDIYWRTFWVNLAYLKNGQRVKAEQVLRELAVWDTQAQDNLYILQSVGAILNDDLETAATLYSRSKNYSYLLEPLGKTISFILKTKGVHKLSNSPDVNFYLEKLFGLKEDLLVEVATTYRAPIPEPLRDRVEGKRGSQSVVAASNTYRQKGNSSLGKYIGLVAIVGIIVAIVVFIPKGNKDSNVQSTPQTAKTVEQQLSGNSQKSNPTSSGSQSGQTSGGSKTGASAASVNKSTTAKPGTSGSATSSVTQKSPISSSAGSSSSSSSVQSQTQVSTSESSVTAHAQSQASTPAPPKEDPIVTLKSSADSGNKDAQYELGMRYYDGNGVSKNMSTAFQYLKPLAEAGYVKAYFPVAEMYHRGQGVAKDRNAAEKWYQKAADSGNSKARNILLNSF